MYALNYTYAGEFVTDDGLIENECITIVIPSEFLRLQEPPADFSELSLPCAMDPDFNGN